MPPATAPLSDAERELRARALEIHGRTCVADLHSHALIGASYLGFDLSRARASPIPLGPLSRWNPLRNLLDLVDLPRAAEGGVGCLVFTAYVLPAFFRAHAPIADRMIARLRALVDRSAGRAVFATTAAEVEAARRDGKIAAMLSVEGGHTLDGRLENLARLRAQGCVYLTLAHFVNNELCGAANDPRPLGMTGLGREALVEMERLGILPDLVHCSAAAKREALDQLRGPAIYSHTGFQRFVPAGRLASDDEVRAIAAKKGLVGVLLSPYWLKGTLRAGVADVVDVIEHVCQLVGPEHVAVGSDFDSGLPPPDGMRDIRDFPEITVEMVRRGFDEATIAKVWSGNFLRVMRAVGR